MYIACPKSICISVAAYVSVCVSSLLLSLLPLSSTFWRTKLNATVLASLAVCLCLFACRSVYVSVSFFLLFLLSSLSCLSLLANCVRKRHLKE